MNYITRGYLVVEAPIYINGIRYCGVDTNAWPIGLEFSSKLAAEIKEHAYGDLSFPLLIDSLSATQYHSACKIHKMKSRMLYCEVLHGDANNEITDCNNFERCTFLGYDYAYPSGDYYSAIANDIIYRRGSLSERWRTHLNQYGLIPSAKEIHLFAQDRFELLQKAECTESLEKGNFIIFRVFSVNDTDAAD